MNASGEPPTTRWYLLHEPKLLELLPNGADEALLALWSDLPVIDVVNDGSVDVMEAIGGSDGLILVVSPDSDEEDDLDEADEADSEPNEEV